MDSVGTEEFYQSEFGSKVIEKTGDSELFQKTLGQRGLNNRDDFKPNDASYMKLTAGPDGILRLHSVHDFTARW